jgi:hypothetical protein
MFNFSGIVQASGEGRTGATRHDAIDLRLVYTHCYLRGVHDQEIKIT